MKFASRPKGLIPRLLYDFVRQYELGNNFTVATVQDMDWSVAILKIFHHSLRSRRFSFNISVRNHSDNYWL